MQEQAVSDVGCFHRTDEKSDKEWSGKTGECAARRAERQAADGLGGKPGRGLPFLDGRLPDALWWLKNKTEGWEGSLGSQ